MHLVSRPCPTDLITQLLGVDLNFDTGPVVAGGAARLLWFNEIAPLMNHTQNRIVGQSDIDVFVYQGHSQLRATRDYIEHRYNRTLIADRDTTGFGMCQSSNIGRYETTNAISYNSCMWQEKYYNIQLIKRPMHSVSEIFDSFDLVNCQFATDGRTVVATPEAVAAWQSHKLVLNPRYQKEVKLDRMLKYLTKGLMPDQPLWKCIMEKTLQARTAGGFPDADYDF